MEAALKKSENSDAEKLSGERTGTLPEDLEEFR